MRDIPGPQFRVAPSDWELVNRAKLKRLLIVVVLVGVVWRCVRFAMRYPIWGDEALLLLNLLDKDYAGLTRQLDNCQIAPILFLWGELTVTRLLGTSEYAVRLLPFLAGITALAVFIRVASLTLSPLGRLFACGIMSVSVWPVTMGANAKPYALDLLMSVSLLWFALEWLRRPPACRWLFGLCLLSPIALLSSYPSVFVASAVILVLLPAVWQSRDRGVMGVFVLLGLLTALTFSVHFLFVGRPHLASAIAGTNTADAMASYWAENFPPASPIRCVIWLGMMHTGEMMSYPIGDANGGGTLTALLLAIGVISLWKSSHRRVVALCLIPFLLNLIAAAMHRYPYGSDRLSLHLAGPIVLLMGHGLSCSVHAFQAPAHRSRLVGCTVGFLVLLALGGTLWHTLRPYRGKDDLWVRSAVTACLSRRPPGASVVVLPSATGDYAVADWYLRSHGIEVVRDVGDFLRGPRDRIMAVQADRVAAKLPLEPAFPAEDIPELKLTRQFTLAQPVRDPDDMQFRFTVSLWRHYLRHVDEATANSSASQPRERQGRY